VLPLVLTLSVQGQTQNVQFDFDLIKDDAIKVAKEMISELGIPDEATLEISETISGLVIAARMKHEDRKQELQQERSDKEEELTQKMKTLVSLNTEQERQHKQQQVQLQQQQYQLDQQQKQLDQNEVDHQQRLQATAQSAQNNDQAESSSDEEGQFQRDLGRIDEGYKFSMAQARKVYDNRISDLQQGQDERDAKHLETMEQHEKDRAEFHDLMKQTQEDENRRIEVLQREWDERRNQLVKNRKSRPDQKEEK